jgi:hypothetical protein
MLVVGLILLVVSVCFVVLYSVPQEMKTVYQSSISFVNGNTGLPYNGQVYTMAYPTLSFNANIGDKVVVSQFLVHTSNNDGWLASDQTKMFIEKTDGDVIGTFSSNIVNVPIIVGSSSLPSHDGYQIELGNNAALSRADLGVYDITVDIYSKANNLLYLIIAIILVAVAIACMITGLTRKTGVR